MATIGLLEGFAEGRPVRYVVAGQTPLTLSGMYVLIRGYDAKGGPLLLARHKQILDSVPGMPGYSSLRVVHFVEVPSELPPDAIQSVQDVMRRGLRLRTPGMIVNAPVVPLDAKSPVYPIVPAWHEGQLIGYLDIGPTPIRTGHVYQAIRGIDKTTGKIIPVPDAKLIFDMLPSHPLYAPICRLHYVRIPDDFDVSHLHSVQHLQDHKLSVRPTTMFLNLPIPDVGI